MADHAKSGPVEVGAKMDYAEHNRSYNAFLHLTKYGALICVAILVAMAFFFFATTGGFINGLFSFILMVLVIIVGTFILR